MKPLVWTGLALGLTIAGAGGWAVWNSTAIAHRDAGGGGLHIEVVAPQEPDLPTGAVMSVGELRDGYVHDPDRLLPPAVLDAENAYVETAWAEPEPMVEPPPERTGGLVWTTLRPAPQPRLEPHDYSFGFDQPLPDQSSGDAGASTQAAAADTSAWDERGLD